MSKKLSGQDDGGEIKDAFKLVGPYKQNGKVYGSSKLPPGVHKDGRLQAGVGSPADLFSENGNLQHPWSAKDDFKKGFGTPVYDEYEEEYLQNVPDELAIETTPFDERNQDSMQNQKVETGKDEESTRGDSLPLCYASFELI